MPFFFCVKLGESATTTHGKLQQAFGDDAISRAQAFRWHKMFSEGRTIVEDEQRSGRPSTTRASDNTARVRELVLSDGRLTVNMSADEANVNREAVRRILTEELGMRKICAKMGPRNLTEQQRDARVSVCAELLEQVEADPQLIDKLSQVTRVGFSNTIQRPNAKVWNGVRRDHQGQRKSACPSQY